MLTLTSISAFSDNYIWVLHNQSDALAVDPGDATPLMHFLEQQKLTLQGILVTHHHPDHVDGVPTLKRCFPDLRVVGPATLKITNEPAQAGQNVRLLDLDFQVLAVPGHTLDHLAYYAAPWLFCGDTLFGAGCGRLFEGTPSQMLTSLQRLANLPSDTLICPAHEYTLANLQFALTVEPLNTALSERFIRDKANRRQNKPTLPCELSLELATNPFLRCHQPSIQHTLEQKEQRVFHNEVEIFAALRDLKNDFKAQDI